MKSNLKFISTKLKMPSPRKNYIIREELFKKLENIFNYKVTMISGMAGSGKTTLLTSFIKEKEFTNFRWVTLDDDNNNVFSFWYYFLEAVQGILGDQSKDIIDLFEKIVHKEDIENIVTILINQLQINEDIFIILDDFQYIKDEYLIKTIELFIKYSSEKIHLIILTREESKIYLGHLTISGSLLEISERELKLSSDEAMSFLKGTLNLNLESTLINKMEKISEGWIGGLQLIALASSNNKNWIKDIKVLNKYVVEYLSNEILQSLKEEEKNFLIRTSILRYFNEEICNNLLDKNNCGEIIDVLLSKNLFLITIDEDKHLYRYHNIFGRFLRLQFSSLDENIRRDIHLKASEIYERIGDLDESIRHVLDIENYKQAIRIIEKMGQNPKGWEYLHRIPLEYIKHNRDITLQKIFYHFCNMEFEQGKHMLDVLKNQIEDEKVLRILQFSMLFIEDKYLDEDTISLQDIEELNLSNVTKSIVYLEMSVFLSMRSKYKEALELINKTIEIEKHIENPYIRFFMLTLKAQIKEELGDLNESEVIYKENFKLIEKHAFLYPLSANNYIAATGVYLKNLNLDKAEEFLNKGKFVMHKSYISLNRGYMHNLMELYILRGNRKEALELINELVELDTHENSMYVASILKYLLILDNMDNELLKKFIDMYKSNNGKSIRLEDHLLYARILLSENRNEEALELIDTILYITRKDKIKVALIEGLFLKINILEKDFQYNKREIINLLREAVYYSYENNIKFSYILVGDKVKSWINLLKSERKEDLSTPEINFLNEIMLILNKDCEEKILSNREIEVLDEIVTGASNKEIGERLNISISTVKTHIINIYSKLQVSNRVEAIEKARKKGIITS